ncbi:MAG TPA: VOC family protein [Polyangiaceae bacterium]|jgi:catechol 2,3-dioxygenase-like lactoylglutathione lyase family enzyme
MTVLSRMIGFVTTTDPARAKAFYVGVLGFRLIGEDDYAVVFDAAGTMIRCGKAKGHTPAQGTILGWQVSDVGAAVRDLAARGVRFEQWGLPFMKQDEHGIWEPGNGDKVAWFKDPDGNVLSVSQHAKT